MTGPERKTALQTASPKPDRKFQDRVDYVAKALKRGSWGRRFEACFEEMDGDHVIAVVMSRGEKNAELKSAIMDAFKVSTWEEVPWHSEREPFLGMSAREIARDAERVRTEKGRVFEQALQEGKGGVAG